MKTAVLGLGLMGAEIALRLRREGADVTCWNRSAARAGAARERGLPVVETAAQAVIDADLVLLVLSDAQAIRDSLFEAPDCAAALAGRILVQMGTIGPDESREIADRAQALGADYLEAPVLGSLPEAREGRLIIMAGGDPALFARCLPVLRELGREPRLIGEVGQGAVLKLAMNQLIVGLTASFSQSLGLVRAEGLDVACFMDVLRGSALHAATFDKKLDKYLAHDYAGANFPLKHLLKDARLFRQVAEAQGMDGAPLAAIEAACERAIGQGLGDQDYSALYEALWQR